MIHAIVVVNNYGNVRFTKFFTDVSEEEQQDVILETYRLVSQRSQHICNFVEVVDMMGQSDLKIIYKHFATLYFAFFVDSVESELGILDLIQVFVETLDSCFDGICELDIIFHPEKVHFVLQEMIQGGMVLETHQNEVIAHYKAQELIQRKEPTFVMQPRNRYNLI